MKCDNIEQYSLRTLEELRKCYEEFLKKTGTDPDFPNMPTASGDGNINIKADQLTSFIDGEEGGNSES